MSTIRERLKAEYVGEYNKGVRVGINQNIIETIKKLVQENMTNQFIKRITGYKEEEIEKIRKEAKIKQKDEKHEK